MVKFSIRIASEEDYDSVLEMSQGIYDGRDYLPCIYHQWLKDTNHYVFLGISDGNIVGLLVAYISDENKTLIHQALRIHRNYRGKGFSSKLTSEVNTWVRCNYPTVVKIRSAVAVAPSHEITHAIHGKEGEHVIVEKDALFYYVEDKMPLLQKLKNVVSHQLFPCSKLNILQLVFSESASDLFEKNIHILKWVPYELIPSNIDEMFNHDDYLFIDFNPTEQMIGSKPHLMSFSQSRISAGRKSTLECDNLHQRSSSVTSSLALSINYSCQGNAGKFSFCCIFKYRNSRPWKTFDERRTSTRTL